MENQYCQFFREKRKMDSQLKIQVIPDQDENDLEK